MGRLRKREGPTAVIVNVRGRPKREHKAWGCYRRRSPIHTERVRLGEDGYPRPRGLFWPVYRNRPVRRLGSYSGSPAAGPSIIVHGERGHRPSLSTGRRRPSVWGTTLLPSERLARVACEEQICVRCALNVRGSFQSHSAGQSSFVTSDSSQSSVCMGA